MQLVKPSVELLNVTAFPLHAIEEAGRTCYKSEESISGSSAAPFVEKLLKRGHEAMIEFADMTMRFVCDRGVTHEIVRHRLFSFAQESTRYCNYKGGVKFIIPCWFERLTKEENLEFNNDLACDESYVDMEGLWLAQMMWSERTYKKLLSDGWTPQQARSVLPNSLKTEIVVKGNFREWRHFFKLRCTPSRIASEQKVDGIYYGANAPHPQMQEVANMALKIAQAQSPIIFDDIK